MHSAGRTTLILGKVTVKGKMDRVRGSKTSYKQSLLPLPLASAG
jgi:hypothetical protein